MPSRLSSGLLSSSFFQTCPGCSVLFELPRRTQAFSRFVFLLTIFCFQRSSASFVSLTFQIIHRPAVPLISSRKIFVLNCFSTKSPDNVEARKFSSRLLRDSRWQKLLRRHKSREARAIESRCIFFATCNIIAEMEFAKHICFRLKSNYIYQVFY